MAGYAINCIHVYLQYKNTQKIYETRMWDNAQCHGRPAQHRLHPLLKAAKFG